MRSTFEVLGSTFEVLGSTFEVLRSTFRVFHQCRCVLVRRWWKGRARASEKISLMKSCDQNFVTCAEGSRRALELPNARRGSHSQ